MVSQAILDQVNRFINWTSRKVQIHLDERPEFYFYEREVWWASLGENVGSETNGKNFHFERPVVIVKKFSKDMLFVIPTTTKTKVGTWYQSIAYDDVQTQAVLAQARTISAKRLIRKIGNLSPEQFQPLVEGFITLIKTNSPTLVEEFSEPLARPM